MKAGGFRPAHRSRNEETGRQRVLLLTTSGHRARNAAVSAKPESALDQLNRRYRPALMSFFLRRVRNHAEAEDLTQDVFVRLAGGDLSRLENSDAYIFQAAANLLRDRSRRNRVRAEYREGKGALEGSLTELLTPARIVVGRESLAQVIDALRGLPERSRTIFILARLEHMKQRDIAEIFGISVSAVEKHIVKALAAVSRSIGADQ